MRKTLRYSIFDPTGNITALVESEVQEEEQPAVASALMRRRPEVEQVGFVRPAADGEAQLSLRMAGGEFCGNASMSTAALYLLRRGLETPAAVTLRVSGALRAVETRLDKKAEDCFAAGVRMPPAREIAERELGFGDMRGKLPLVRMEGIAHLMLTPELVFFALLRDGEAAGRAARAWADELSAEALGLMFLETAAPQPRLTPLVCVPGSGTLFWERSCASGTAAAGAYLASLTGTRAELTLREPGGSLRVESEADGETWLFGRTRLLESCEEEFVL